MLSKHEGKYYVHSDGRVTQDWTGIASDEFVKVFKAKDCVYAICGNADSVLMLHEVFNKGSKPTQVLRTMSSPEFYPFLKSCSVLVGTAHHGCYSISINPKGFLSDALDVSIIPWPDNSLPQVKGSGFLNVKTLLAAKDKVTPTLVKKSIKDSYKVNHTIGGSIFEASIAINKDSK